MAVCTASPPSALFRLPFTKEISRTIGLIFFLCAHPFLPLSLLILCHPVFKKRLTAALSAGALSSYADSIAHHFFSFITLTISQESWRHYATCCNTITSLSHFSIVLVFQQIQMSHHTRETRCDFLPLPDNQVTLWLVGHL